MASLALLKQVTLSHQPSSREQMVYAKITYVIGRYDTIGIDLVAMAVNVLVAQVQRAEPLWINTAVVSWRLISLSRW